MQKSALVRAIRLGLLSGLCLSSLGSSGCSGLISFDVNSQGNSTVPGSSPLLNLGGTPFSGFNNISFSQSQAFQNNNTNKDHVSSARLTAFTLKVSAPSSQDLSFLRSVSFKIKTSTLGPQEIAHLESFPAGAKSVQLTLDDLELAPYVKSDSFTITTDAQGQSPPQDTTLEADLTLHIGASIL